MTRRRIAQSAESPVRYLRCAGSAAHKGRTSADGRFREGTRFRRIWRRRRLARIDYRRKSSLGYRQGHHRRLGSPLPIDGGTVMPRHGPGSKGRTSLDQARCSAPHDAGGSARGVGIHGLTEEEKVRWNDVWHRLKPWPIGPVSVASRKDTRSRRLRTGMFHYWLTWRKTQRYPGIDSVVGVSPPLQYGSRSVLDRRGTTQREARGRHDGGRAQNRSRRSA